MEQLWLNRDGRGVAGLRVRVAAGKAREHSQSKGCSRSNGPRPHPVERRPGAGSLKCFVSGDIRGNGYLRVSSFAECNGQLYTAIGQHIYERIDDRREPQTPTLQIDLKGLTTSPQLCQKSPARRAPASQATSSRIAGRHHLGISGRLRRNLHAGDQNWSAGTSLSEVASHIRFTS
jgi:hypothetical protein